MRLKLSYPLIIACVIFLVYLNSLFNGFVWLDEAEILNKKLIISDFDSFKQMFLFDDNNYQGYHRPMYNLMHSFDYLIWKENAFGYHLSSLVLHIINALLIYGIALNLSGRKFVSKGIALLFGLLPCHTAAVSLIHSKADLLACLFILLPIYGFSKSKSKSGTSISIGKTLLWCLLFLLALLSKEVAIMLPFFLIGVYFIFNKESLQIPKKLLFLPTLIGLIFILYRLSATATTIDSESPVLYKRILTFVPVYIKYFTHTLSGFELTTNDAVRSIDVIGKFEMLFYSFAFISLLNVQYYYAKKSKIIAAGFLWFNLFLIPVSQIVPILHFRADRFLYIPSIGLIVALVFVFEHHYNQFKWHNYKRQIIYAFAGVLALASLRIFDRNKDFVSNEVLFGKLILSHPECREAQSFVGNDHLVKGNIDKALIHINKALEKQEDYYSFVDEKSTYGNLGVIYLYQNKNSEALDIFLRLKAQPDFNPEVLFNIGICYKRERNFELAKDHLLDYLNLKPDNIDALFNLGAIGFEIGDREMTRKYFSRYLELNPTSEYRQEVEELMGQ